MNVKDIEYYLTLHRFDYNFYLRVTKIYDFIMNHPEAFRNADHRDNVFTELKAKLASVHSDSYEDLIRSFISKRSFSIERFIENHPLDVLLYTKSIMEALYTFSTLVVTKNYVGIDSDIPRMMAFNVAKNYIQAVKDDNEEQWVYLRSLRIMVIGGLLRDTIHKDNVTTIINILIQIVENKREIIQEIYDEDEIYYKTMMDSFDLECAFYDSRSKLDELANSKLEAYKKGFAEAKTLQEKNYYESLFNTLLKAYQEYDPKLQISNGEMGIFNEYLDFLALNMKDRDFMFYHTPDEFSDVYVDAKKFLKVCTKDNIKEYLLNSVDIKYRSDEISPQKYRRDILAMKKYGVLNPIEAENLLDGIKVDSYE